MASLEINFRCMCLFVPEPGALQSRLGTVHVLMPITASCCDGKGTGVEEHVVKLVHDYGSNPKGVSLAGWTLELGNEPGTAEVSLKPRVEPQEEEFKPEIVDLSRFTNREVPRELLSGGDAVNARVVLRRGYVHSLAAEAHWQIGEEILFMAHRVTWRIDGISANEVRWTGPDGATDVPVDILALPSEDGQENDAVIRFGIHHQPERVIEQPDEPILDPDEVTAHFRAFHGMFGLGTAEELPVPMIKDPPPGQLVDCLTATARLAR